MSYTLQHSDINIGSVTVIPLTVDSVSTSLTFWGRGVPNFGEIEQNNFLKLLENFASDTAPLYPTPGQLWYKKTDKQLKVYVDGANGWKNVNAVDISTIQPVTAQTGDLWYNVNNGVLYVWNSTAWVVPPAVCLVQDTAPTNPVLGMLWYETLTTTLKLWNGLTWVDIANTSFKRDPSLDYLALVF